MKNFKGFDDWIEIFKGGKQIDSNGHEHDGDAVILKALETFKPSYHEPPLVAGHPKDNSPAFGWVSDLKEKDGTLLAKFKDVVPEFSQSVEKGMFKKRSASFYNDGRLRHVGFLGGTPPAVKGLADLSFSDDDKAVTFEFGAVDSWTWETVGGVFRKMRDYFIEKEGKEKA
ncbi:MAG: peptidase, partial [Deltaproteobacteria bacterium]